MEQNSVEQNIPIDETCVAYLRFNGGGPPMLLVYENDRSRNSYMQQFSRGGLAHMWVNRTTIVRCDSVAMFYIEDKKS